MSAKASDASEKLLVLLAGQSNMAGRGYAGPDDLTPIPNVLMIRPDGKWQPAIEPITKDRPFIGTFQASGEKIVSSDPFETVLPQGDQKVVGVGLGRTFGRLLAEANPGRTVGLIPCAVGGTSIAAWMPGGVDDHDPNNFPYDNAVKKAREAQKSGKIVAMLWHQGETDAKKQTPEYTEKLRTVIRNFRRDLNLGDEVPFIAGDMASFYPERIAPHIGIVDRALDELAAEDPSFRYVHTKDLTHRGDNLHFDTDSLHELGRRYFEAYRQFKADPETCGLHTGLENFTVSRHENTVFQGELKMAKPIPHPMVWQFDTSSLRGKQYLKDLDFIHEHTLVDHISIACVDGVQLENLQQCHEAMKELVAHAHELGIKVVFRNTGVEGFFNALVNTPAGTPVEVDQAQIFPLDYADEAEGIVNDYELTADENGRAVLEHHAKWARNKIRPLRNRLLKVYAFQKAGEGFYRPESLEDVTDCARIVNSRTGYAEIEFDGGKSCAGKTLFFMVVQYFNYNELFGDAHWRAVKKLLDNYADVPFSGMSMDEFGYVLLNTAGISRGAEEPFRGRFYSPAQEKYYREKHQIELKRMLFDMRYAPLGNEAVRILAVNRYFEELRVPVIRHENNVADYTRKLWGDEVYLSCHNTFHNHLDNDEIWRTATAWWDLPRDFGHTDENIDYPVRMGIMLAAREPVMFDMFYSRDPEAHYRHMAEGAPFNCREFHHSYNDMVWGQSFKEPDFLKMIRHFDAEIRKLDDFQTFYPRLDLLIIYGFSAQNNWYPDESARNKWDIDGTLHIQEKSTEMWNAGYRCALVPDYAVTDGRIRHQDGKIFFNGHGFTHCLFLYPKYAKPQVYDFLNGLGAAGIPAAAVGRADIDFYGNAASLTIPVYPDFSLDILEKMNCPKSAVPNGCVYEDGSFCLVSLKGLRDNEPEPVDLEIGGLHYRGTNTGILAWRNGELQVSTPGGSLKVIS